MGNGLDFALDIVRGDLSEHQLRNMSDAMRPLAVELRAAYAARKTLGGKDVVFKSGHWNEPNILAQDRKSTRLNSSHLVISYAVFCLKKKTIIYNSIPYIRG